MVSVKVKTAFSVLVPFLNPNCLEVKFCLRTNVGFNLLNFKVSRTFDNDGNSNIGL
jgi:hypothetical protein